MESNSSYTAVKIVHCGRHHMGTHEEYEPSGWLMEHFQLSLDESWLMANASGLYIIAGRPKIKTEKKTHDSWFILQWLVLGMYLEVKGLWLSSERKKIRIKNQLTSLTQILSKTNNAAGRSTCHPTRNVYLIYSVWLELAPIMAKGIRPIKIIWKHLDWWVSFIWMVIAAMLISPLRSRYLSAIKFWLSRKKQTALQQISHTISYLPRRKNPYCYHLLICFQDFTG